MRSGRGTAPRGRPRQVRDLDVLADGRKYSASDVHKATGGRLADVVERLERLVRDGVIEGDKYRGRRWYRLWPSGGPQGER